MRSQNGSTATACTSPTIPARPGPTSDSTTHARSDACSSIRAIRTSSSSLRWGTCMDPTPSAGCLPLRDGGSTWQRVLFRNDNVGAVDLAIDPSNSQVLYASLWNTRRPPWSIYPPSYGPGSGLFKSSDGGTTWNQLTRLRPRAWAASASRSRRRCRTGRATQLSTRKRAASIDRRTRAPPGRRFPAIRASRGAAGTSARLRSTRRTPTSSSSPTRRSSDPGTPGEAGLPSRDHREETTAGALDFARGFQTASSSPATRERSSALTRPRRSRRGARR